MELKEIINYIKECIKESHLSNIDDNMILSCATKIYNNGTMELNKINHGIEPEIDTDFKEIMTKSITKPIKSKKGGK